MKFTESDFGDAALARLGELQFAVLHGLGPVHEPRFVT